MPDDVKLKIGAENEGLKLAAAESEKVVEELVRKWKETINSDGAENFVKNAVRDIEGDLSPAIKDLDDDVGGLEESLDRMAEGRQFKQMAQAATGLLVVAAGVRTTLTGVWDAARGRTEAAIESIKQYNQNLLETIRRTVDFNSSLDDIRGVSAIESRQKSIETLQKALDAANANQPGLEDAARGFTTDIDIAKLSANERLQKNLRRQISDQITLLNLDKERLRVQKEAEQNRQRQGEVAQAFRNAAEQRAAENQQRQSLTQGGFRRAFDNVEDTEKKRLSDAEKLAKLNRDSEIQQEQSSGRQLRFDRRREDIAKRLKRLAEDSAKTLGGFDRGFASLGNRIATASSASGESNESRRLQDLKEQQKRLAEDEKRAEGVADKKRLEIINAIKQINTGMS